MAWLATNWFWILISIAFIGMHLFGHGGHGGHGKKQDQPDTNDNDNDKNNDVERGTASERSGGHRH